MCFFVLSNAIGNLIRRHQSFLGIIVCEKKIFWSLLYSCNFRSKNLRGLQANPACRVSKWRRSLLGFLLSGANIARQTTHCGRSLPSTIMFVKPIFKYSLSYFLTFVAKVTGLQINGQEVTKTHVFDQNQNVRLLDSTKNEDSSLRQEDGSLVISRVFHCHDVWPTIRCEAPHSELNYSVAILVRCTRMLTNQTFFEEITAKENAQYNFSFRPKDEVRETAKDPVFIIEVKLCDNGNSHLVCRCRWISENISPCKNMGNVTICDVYNSEMLLSILIKRSYTDLMWELYRHNSAPRVVKLTTLHVRYPANVTGLQVNGQEVNQTRVIDEKQEVSVSCFFTNGNPLVSVRLIDDTGRAQSSKTHGQGPLTLSLGQFRCQDVWPTIKCEAPESEHNRSVVIFGKCPPQFLHTETQVLALRRVLQEGLTLRLRSYTSNIRKCHMTRLSPQPAYIEVACGLSGSAPEFNLTLHFIADSDIAEGIWMLHATTEIGSSNITFMITNNTSEFGNQRPAMTSGNKRLNTGNPDTECEASEMGKLTCKFSTNINSTQTDFSVYFHSDNGHEELLVDCVWVDGELQCISQEGIECKEPVSQIAEISLSTQFVRRPGIYKCIAGLGHGNVQLCQIAKSHQENKRELTDDKADESFLPIATTVLGPTLGIITVVAVAAIIYKIRKKKRELRLEDSIPEERESMMPAELGYSSRKSNSLPTQTTSKNVKLYGTL